MKEEFSTVEGVSREYPGSLDLDVDIDVELVLALALGLDGFGMILPVRASWARCLRYILFLFRWLG